MSQENVEVVRRAYEIALHGADPRAAFDQCVRERLFASDVEWRFGPRGGRAVAGLENTVGRDGYLAMLSRFAEDFEGLRLEAERIIDAGGDRVVAIVRASGTGRRSSAPVKMRIAYVFWLEASRIVRVDPYLDPTEALRALGLSE
jgi:ketosteroid isomerase-like protein